MAEVEEQNKANESTKYIDSEATLTNGIPVYISSTTGTKHTQDVFKAVYSAYDTDKKQTPGFTVIPKDTAMGQLQAGSRYYYNQGNEGVNTAVDAVDTAITPPIRAITNTLFGPGDRKFPVDKPPAHFGFKEIKDATLGNTPEQLAANAALMAVSGPGGKAAVQQSTGLLPIIRRVVAGGVGALFGGEVTGSNQGQDLTSFERFRKPLMTAGMIATGEGLMGVLNRVGGSLSEKAQAQVKGDFAVIMKKHFGDDTVTKDKVEAILSTKRGLEDFSQSGIKAIKNDIADSSKQLVDNVYSGERILRSQPGNPYLKPTSPTLTGGPIELRQQLEGGVPAGRYTRKSDDGSYISKDPAVEALIAPKVGKVAERKAREVDELVESTLKQQEKDLSKHMDRYIEKNNDLLDNMGDPKKVIAIEKEIAKLKDETRLFVKKPLGLPGDDNPANIIKREVRLESTLKEFDVKQVKLREAAEVYHHMRESGMGEGATAQKFQSYIKGREASGSGYVDKNKTGLLYETADAFSRGSMGENARQQVDYKGGQGLNEAGKGLTGWARPVGSLLQGMSKAAGTRYVGKVQGLSDSRPVDLGLIDQYFKREDK